MIFYTIHLFFTCHFYWFIYSQMWFFQMILLFPRDFHMIHLLLYARFMFTCFFYFMWLLYFLIWLLHMIHVYSHYFFIWFIYFHVILFNLFMYFHDSFIFTIDFYPLFSHMIIDYLFLHVIHLFTHNSFIFTWWHVVKFFRCDFTTVHSFSHITCNLMP